jgi:ABC-type transport system involved in cytochrome bd biosynthesis fused ATPase/permease subunit
MKYFKYLQSLSPFIVAVLANVGVVMTETQASTLINVSIALLTALVGVITPSVRAVILHQEKAE